MNRVLLYASVIEHMTTYEGSASTMLNACRVALPGGNCHVFGRPTVDGKKASHELKVCALVEGLCTSVRDQT